MSDANKYQHEFPDADDLEAYLREAYQDNCDFSVAVNCVFEKLTALEAENLRLKGELARAKVEELKEAVIAIEDHWGIDTGLARCVRQRIAALEAGK